MLIQDTKQESLFLYLSRSGGLTAEISRPGTIRNSKVINALDGTQKFFRVENSHVYVGKIENCTLVKRKYFVTPDNCFLAEGLTHSDYFITWEGLDGSGLGVGRNLVDQDQRINLEFDCPPTTFEDECIFIGGDTIVEPNFAHWFFEHLLKLKALKTAEVNLDLPVIVSERLPRRFLEWADLLFGQPLNWLRTDLSQPIKFTLAWVSSCPAYRKKGGAQPTLWADGFDFLHSHYRSLFASEIASRPVDVPQVLFLSRSKARWRRAVNEAEIFEVANRILGAQLVHMAEHSISEQVRMISQAEIILTFAGADGPIVNFCNPRAKVIEFCAPNHGAYYTSLVFCAFRHLEYIRIPAERFVGEVLGPHPLDANYVIDPNIATLVLNKVIQNIDC